MNPVVPLFVEYGGNLTARRRGAIGDQNGP